MLGQLHDSDIKLLRVFHVIAECGGFSAAQARLNISQSAISTQMAQLEGRLGCRLCERGRGHFELTEDGITVLEASEKLFSAIENFRGDVAEGLGNLIGELRLGLIDNTVTHEDSRIRDALDAFYKEAPEASLSIYVGGARELEQQLLDGRLHLAIGLFHHQISSIIYAPLFDEEHRLYCAVNHPLYDIPDAAIEDDALRSSQYVSWGYVEEQHGWEPPFEFSKTVASPFLEGVVYMILSGRFVGYLPAHYAEFWVQRGQMRPVFPSRLRRSFQFSVIRRRAGRQSHLTRVFLKHLKLEKTVPENNE
ncbi:LysR family transcriptional regulator [Luminiphilus sp.]|nr:LysR family transcriptional regulator [Luminiphilus sp.]MDA9722037.1 LysR family transcriptional regulator [Luminiphilus sp.]